MFPTSRALLGAVMGLSAAFSLSPAYSHAVCGDRVFPATLGIDDPGVGDELALPTVTMSPQDPNDQHVTTTATFNYTKTIFPGFGLSVGYGPQWTTTTPGFQGGYGFGNLTTEAKYKVFCLPEHEFMGSVGLIVNWGNTSTNGQGNPFNTYQPVLDVGKGFGDLPKSLNALRPLAVTFALSESLPGQAWTNGVNNTTNLNWGFTIQYSLPFFNSHISEIDNSFVKHLVPITEFTFSKPIANLAGNPNPTTGTIQPGVIYMADTWQFAVEAILPLNSQSGRGVGAVGELHFFFDDIFPNSLGKPIFGGRS